MANYEIEPGKALRLTEDLIRIPSVKGDSVAMAEALSLAKRELDGLPYTEFTDINPQGEKIPGLLYFNTPKQPEHFRVLLHAHLDVVPPQHDSQFIPEIRDGKLFGRGAYDMKSGAAGLITAYRSIASSLEFPVGLSLTVDEETGGFHGAKYQVDQGVRSDFVISGEGSDFKMGNEHKGVLILKFDLDAYGGHTAYEGDEANAVQQMVNFLGAVNQLYPGPTGEWRTTSSLTDISTGNKAHNVVPSDASAEINIRWIPQENPENIKRSISKLNPKVRISEGAFGEAHQTPTDHPDLKLLAKAIKSATGKEAEFIKKSGSTDLRHWTSAGSEGIDFGPVGDGLHTEDEFVEIASLDQYVKIVSTFLQSLR